MGHGFQSELRRWDVLTGLCETISAKSFVEIGCKEGRTCSTLLKHFPELKVLAVDPWRPVTNDDEDYKDWDFSAIEAEFWANVGDAKDRCVMHQGTSEQAWHWVTQGRHWGEQLGGERGAGEYCDMGPFDAIFIDAAHDYANVMEDIKLWWPLLKEGGYLAGHDYQHNFPGVMRAVAASFPLIRVALCPDSVWVVQKEPDLKLLAAP